MHGRICEIFPLKTCLYLFIANNKALLLLAEGVGRNCSKPVKVKCCLFQSERTIFENVS